MSTARKKCLLNTVNGLSENGQPNDQFASGRIAFLSQIIDTAMHASNLFLPKPIQRTMQLRSEQSRVHQPGPNENIALLARVL